MAQEIEYATAEQVAENILATIDGVVRAIASAGRLQPVETEQAASAIRQLAEARALLLDLPEDH